SSADLSHSFPTRRSSDLGYSFSLFFVPMLLLQSKIYIKIAGMLFVAAAHYFLIGHSLVEIAIFAGLYLIVIFTIPFFKSMNTHRSEEHTSELQSRFDLVC